MESSRHLYQTDNIYCLASWKKYRFWVFYVHLWKVQGGVPPSACIPPPPNELIFGKAGLSVIWSLLKQWLKFCLARIVKSKVRLKAASTDCILECFRNIKDLSWASPCTRALSHVRCSPSRMNMVPGRNPMVLTPWPLLTRALLQSYYTPVTLGVKIHSCSLGLGRGSLEKWELPFWWVFCLYSLC